ncbi:MAG: lysoplasmalogenase [Bacteroidetes bacterium]|nr:MAG: lysoplasmalogenase [Bacteroidota bacterium]
MKKKAWIILFLFVLFTNLLAIYLDNDTLRFISKSALMPVLATYFLTQTRSGSSGLKTWILLALIFSWIGDLLLLFEEKKSVFFLLGLSSFFVAQVFYIVFFHNIRMKEYIRGNALLLLLVIVYYFILMSIVSPFLGNMKLAVRIYGVVLSFMWMLAMHTLFSKNKKAGWWMTLGAILFVASDSLLAINKFYSTFNYAPLMIMLTYGLAQLFIAEGAVRYINSIRN